MPSLLILTCDDAGFASVDRGIRRLAEATGKPLCADYMILQEGAIERARAMRSVPNVSVGLHFELFGMPDADRHYLGKDVNKKGSSLSEQSEIQEKAIEDARHQLKVFRDALGSDPAHIGTHGNFHTNLSGEIQAWWMDLMHELFGEKVPPMQLEIPHVRHNMYSWNLEPTFRLPLTPEQFGEELRKRKDHKAVEFVLHPGIPEAGDPSIDMLFSAEMRVRDTEAAIAIVNSGVIEHEGFEVVPVYGIRRA
jgi:predicted glycoside hydrolase/deacetylase ChbG (UPF0249 family)